ncbi:MAG: hypothetical protein AVDCRST_MAG59-4730, partial [uncultured Thermomicrobiales bacterium]
CGASSPSPTRPPFLPPSASAPGTPSGRRRGNGSSFGGRRSGAVASVITGPPAAP